jgi:hypothetical protein
MTKKSGESIVKYEQEGYYSLRVDKKINRMFIEFLGVWQSRDEVPNYLADIAKTLVQVKEGYTLLVLIHDKRPPKLAITKLHKVAMKACMAAKYSKCAIAFPKGTMLQKMSTNVIGKLAGFDWKTFDGEEAALKWLDKKKGELDPKKK